MKYGILMGQIMETASSREDQGPIFGATTPTWEGEQSEKVKKKKNKNNPHLAKKTRLLDFGYLLFLRVPKVYSKAPWHGGAGWRSRRGMGQKFCL